MVRSSPLVLVAAAFVTAAVLPLSGQAPVFTEQTVGAGLGGVTFIPGTYSHSNYTGPVACGDFDRDGDQDLFVPAGGGNGLPDRLFVNNGDGTFTDQAAAWGLTAVHKGKGIAVADYNGDGWLDIYLTSAGAGLTGVAGQHRLYQNSGTGSFTNVAVAAGVNMTSTSEDGFGCCFGDIDRDGDLDLFVSGFAPSNGGSKLFQNNGNGTFSNITAAIGLFSGLPGSSGFAPRLQDMDGDHYPELLFVADFGTSRYFKNDGDGTFTEMSGAAGTAQEENGMGQTVGDYNNDGLIDWYVTSIYNPTINWTGNKHYLNLGNHSYGESAQAAGCDDGGYGWGAISIDVDHDRMVDILETNGAGGQFDNEQSYFWRNLGSGSSYAEVAIASGIVHQGAGRGIINLDYDNDGDQDVVIAGNFEPLRLFRNDTPAGGRHWLRVLLDTDLDPTVAADGIGAEVRVTSASGTLYRWIDSGDTFQSQSELSAHFGLGLDDVISELRVVWPDGVEQVVPSVAVDQTIVVHRGTGLLQIIRGDANGDGAIDISDPVAMLAGLFGGPTAPCEEAAEVNGDGLYNIADPVYLLAHLFTMGPNPIAPFPGCGPVTPSLSCNQTSCP